MCELMIVHARFLAETVSTSVKTTPQKKATIWAISHRGGGGGGVGAGKLYNMGSAGKFPIERHTPLSRSLSASVLPTGHSE